jgi:SAM-dependent methyltransferase
VSGEAFERLHVFDRVDESEQVQQLISFLAWAEAIPDVIARRARSYALLGAGTGKTIADVGCGIGTVLADLTGLGARAVGVDSSEAMLREAARRVPDAELYVADAGALPFEDGALSGYRSERVYQHLADPEAALEEAMRVLEPGGRIVLVDQDWDMFVVDGDDRDATRSMLHGFADSLPNPWAGRRSGLALEAAGFVDVAIEAETVTRTDFEYAAPFLPAIEAAAVETGAVDADAARAWIDEQRRRGEEGRYFSAMTHFLSSATRP